MAIQTELQSIKQRFEIVGNSSRLNFALEIAMKVAPTDISVLIYGESGVGKESFSKIIHHLSARKHGPFISVNCGAIPEGTVDSELFGHEKGSFTGATESRKGYFETVNGGTIFLDEIGELPLGTQARLLRVLESGEFIRVGSSKVQKTNVRVVAATNKDLLELSHVGRFREDLYYRLATVPIRVPKLSERREDIILIFKKFSGVFSEKYKTSIVQLDAEAQTYLENYPWPGNIRELKNITEQLCVLESEKIVGVDVLKKYLPPVNSSLPVFAGSGNESGASFSERDIFYKFLIDLKKDVSELKKVVIGLIENTSNKEEFISRNSDIIRHVLAGESNLEDSEIMQPVVIRTHHNDEEHHNEDNTHTIQVEESFTIAEHELDMIKKALNRNMGRRKRAAQELGISERTLYRKIKQYNLE